MSQNYFHRLQAETPTRFWINNPSGSDLEQAIEAGAINCTTNPAYCSKLLSSDKGYLNDVIDQVLVNVTRDIEQAAVHVYQRAAKRAMDAFLPLHELSGGQCGFVTIQDDPREDQDCEAIMRCVRSNRALGPNYMAKIPVIKGGMEAIEACVAENVPICATEIFSLAQARQVCELYEAAARRTGNRPPFYVTHITGIFDEYAGKVAAREGTDIAPDILDQAGCAIARREYKLLAGRGYESTMLGGGARSTQHFTEMVGGDVHVTINWSTAEELLAANPPLVPRLQVDTPPEVIDELRRLPAFSQAYDEDGLAPEEYAEFGPVQLFRNAFLQGWYTLLAQVAARRHFHAL